MDNSTQNVLDHDDYVARQRAWEDECKRVRAINERIADCAFETSGGKKCGPW